MEASISAFCRSLAAFCNHVQSSSQALSDSIRRRPIPLDSAASTFLQSLERRISSTASDLDLLESMTLGTVSFEELLGHCNEVYKVNQSCISDIQDRMIGFGYVPEIELDDEDEELLGVDPNILSPISGSVSVLRSNRKGFEEDGLFEDSISLQNLGLSDAALATLASEDDDNLASPVIFSRKEMSPKNGHLTAKKTEHHPAEDLFNSSELPMADSLKADGTSRTLIRTSKEDYNNLPSYMKSLASWEDLQDAVAKMNSHLSSNGEATGNNTLSQDVLESLGLGRKGKSYLLLLLRMNQLVVENVDGSVFYRVRL